MTNWREQVLRQFNSNNPLYLVLDSDQLLLDEVILSNLNKENIKVINLEDGIHFRFEFESEYRSHVEKRSACVIVRSEKNDFTIFPYDLLQSGQHIRLNISNIYPKFSLQVTRQLHPETYDALYTAHEQYQGSSSDKETLEFLTKSMFKIPYDTVYSKADLWKLLLTIHYENSDVPMVIKEFIINILLPKVEFAKLSIKKLVTSRSYFYNYLGEEWARFVSEIDKLTNSQQGITLEREEYYLTHAFAKLYIRGIIDNLFVEKLVKQVTGYKVKHFPSWMQFGIKTDEVQDSTEELVYLYERIKEIEFKELRYQDWFKVAELYGQFKYGSLKANQYNEELITVTKEIDSTFETWMLEYYRSLITLPHLPKPKMVHQIPHYIATQNEEKVALLVMDGMSFVQWAQVREMLVNVGLSFEENAVFAWVPTLTSVSRQAIFSGNRPSFFADSIATTNKEPLLWSTFWEDHGIPRANIVHQRSLGKSPYDKENISAFKHPNIRAYGAVIDIVDRILHGAVQGSKSVSSELTIWLETNYLNQLIQDLHQQGFTIYLTADHGNKESIGIGRISEGVLADTKGERVRIYNSPELRDFTADKNPKALKWNDIGLPDNFHVLVAKEAAAFVNKGDKIMSHGGISMEEVIVPFIKVFNNSEVN